MQNKQPSQLEKLTLQHAGLGRKTIVFGRSDDASTFMEKVETVFPKLKHGDGFEILQSGVLQKDLMVLTPPPSGYSVPFIQDSSGLGQALAYVRPLQRSLDVNPAATFFRVCYLFFQVVYSC